MTYKEVGEGHDSYCTEEHVSCVDCRQYRGTFLDDVAWLNVIHIQIKTSVVQTCQGFDTQFVLAQICPPQLPLFRSLCQQLILDNNLYVLPASS